MATKMELSGLDWSKFKYMVFDAPNQEGSYEERYQRLGKQIPKVVSD